MILNIIYDFFLFCMFVFYFVYSVFFIVLYIISPFVYSSFLFLYKFTDHCHRVKNQLQ